MGPADTVTTLTSARSLTLVNEPGSRVEGPHRRVVKFNIFARCLHYGRQTGKLRGKFNFPYPRHHAGNAGALKRSLLNGMMLLQAKICCIL
eukprot:5460115-Amphidinium_carterae.1